MNIPEHISESLETIFWIKFFDADPGSFILDPGSEYKHTGPQHWFLLSVVRTNLSVLNLLEGLS